MGFMNEMGLIDLVCDWLKQCGFLKFFVVHCLRLNQLFI